jgi:hypothetical protein
MGDRRTDLEAVLKLVQSQLMRWGMQRLAASTLSKEEEEAR